MNSEQRFNLSVIGIAALVVVALIFCITNYQTQTWKALVEHGYSEHQLPGSTSTYWAAPDSK